MLAAGLLAQKAVAAGLSVPAFVKTSLAPGSRVVSRYLERAGLDKALEALGFFTVGYGCTTCSGKSGPLFGEIAAAVDDHGLVAAAVLSGNRNFEGRVHRQVRANYIGSPLVVVAYALAGRMDIDFDGEPLGFGPDGGPVFLRELWPSEEELAAVLPVSRDPALYRDNYANLTQGTHHWQSLDAPQGPRFPWSPGSTYIVEPPFFAMPAEPAGDTLLGARALGLYGDGLTTDHIAPAGEIPTASEAGRYLASLGIPPSEFNAYTMRRGNHHVMMRGAFSNVRIRNHMVPGSEGGVTRIWPEGTEATVFAAAETYRTRSTPLLVMGGENYGMGSSRDWAAKGPALLGVRAVIANSFERIHRANLISLGILPLLFEPGSGWRQLGLTGVESFDIRGIAAALDGAGPAEVTATDPDGRSVRFPVEVDIVAPVEAQRLREGGIFVPSTRRRASPEKPASEMETTP